MSDPKEKLIEQLSDALELAVMWLEAIVSDGTLPESRRQIIKQAKAALRRVGRTYGKGRI